jgi:hypothetical protein
MVERGLQWFALKAGDAKKKLYSTTAVEFRSIGTKRARNRSLVEISKHLGT